VAAVAAAVAVAAIPTVVQLTIDDGDGVLHVLSARRTVRWHSERPGMIPLYSSRQRMRSDNTTVIHMQKGLSITLRPDEVRCLRAPAGN